MSLFDHRHEHWCHDCGEEISCAVKNCTQEEEITCENCQEEQLLELADGYYDDDELPRHLWLDGDAYAHDSPYPDDIYDDFADPGGNSALRAASPSNPRNLPCPTCKKPNRLTPKDRQLGYQCDACADRAERGGF